MRISGRRAGRALPLALLCLVIWAWPTLLWAQSELQFDQALRMVTGPDPTAQSVALPDAGLAERIDTPSTAVYRVQFKREALEAVLRATTAPQHPLVGIYVDRACSDLTVRINGMVIHRSPHREFNRFQDCYEPQLIPMAWALLQPGSNQLELQINGWPLHWVSTARRAIGLSVVRVGDYETLRAEHRRESTLAADFPAITSGALLLLGTLTLCLLAFAPRQRHLAYFGVMCMLWAGINARGWWSLPVDDPLMREGLLVIMISVVSWCYQRFVCLYADLSSPLLDDLARLQVVCVPFAVALAGVTHMFHVASVVNLIAAVLVGTSTVLFIAHSRQPRRRPMRGMALVFALGLMMVVLELAVSLGLMSAQHNLPLRWGIPLCLTFLGALQMMEFGRQAHQLEVVQRQLEQKIELARREIEANFNRLADDRIEQVTAGERKRIAADLHDDLGAKLLTIVHTSRSDRIASLGREALDEMRLSVRGLTGRPMELSEALADWRTEAMTRLSPTGIDLDWPLPLDDLPQVLGARAMVQTTRILREIFNNLIRHSQANRCAVHTSVQDDRLRIEIRDDGQGFDVAALSARQAGLGLLNMQHRARQLRGECLIESTPGQGSRVQLMLPLDNSGA